MKKRINKSERLAGAALRDAMHHILADEGVFTLADGANPERFRMWNGFEWHEELLPVEAAAVELQPAHAE